MRTLEQTTQEVLDLATKHFQLPAGSLAPEDDFFKKLGIDSLQTLEMLSRLESFRYRAARLRGSMRERLQDPSRTHSVPPVREPLQPQSHRETAIVRRPLAESTARGEYLT